MARKPFTGAVTSPYGYRIHPISGLFLLHTGEDGIGAGNFAPADGVLTGYGWNGGYGNQVSFRDKHGWGHTLSHCATDTPSVPVGSWVPEGTLLAPMGTTGNSTGVHCHWEVFMPDGTRVDPEVWVAATAHETAALDSTPFPPAPPKPKGNTMAILYIFVEGDPKKGTFKQTGGSNLVNEDGTAEFYLQGTPEFNALKASLEPSGNVVYAYASNVRHLRRELMKLWGKGELAEKLTLLDVDKNTTIAEVPAA